MFKLLCFLAAVLAFAGCGPSTKPTSSQSQAVTSAGVSIGVAAEVAQATSIAMGAMAHGSGNCTTISNACSTYPCSATETVTLGSTCPFALGAGTPAGTIHVTGTWSSASAATLSFTFSNTTVGSRSTLVASATSISSSQSGNVITVAYAGQNVTVNGSTAVGSQSSWSINVDTAGTAQDTSDDTLTITGADQSMSGSSSNQVSLSNVLVVPTCRLNPTSGSATVQAMSPTGISQEVLRFHTACDGSADVLASMGTSASATVQVSFVN